MGGLSSILTGLVLLGIALWLFATGGSVETAAFFFVGALFLFWRGFHGAGIVQDGDVTAPIEFVSNPAGAIVETAVDTAADRFTGLFSPPSSPTEEQPKFDPDAIIAKYMENRPMEAPPAPARQSFGRKTS